VKTSLVFAALLISFLIVGVDVQPVVAAKPQPQPVAISFSVQGAAIKQGPLVSPPGTPANPCDYQGRTAIFTLYPAEGVGTVDARGVARGVFTADVVFQMMDFILVNDVCVPGSPGEILFAGSLTGTWTAKVDPLSPTAVQEFGVQFQSKQPIIHGLMTDRISNPVVIPGLNGYLVVDNKAWIAGSPTGLFDVEISSAAA
jgi:hypothetical protein